MTKKLSAENLDKIRGLACVGYCGECWASRGLLGHIGALDAEIADLIAERDGSNECLRKLASLAFPGEFDSVDAIKAIFKERDSLRSKLKKAKGALTRINKAQLCGGDMAIIAGEALAEINK